MRKSTPNFRLGFLLQQSNREIYQVFGRKIVAACHERRDEVIHRITSYNVCYTKLLRDMRQHVSGLADHRLGVVAEVESMRRAVEELDVLRVHRADDVQRGIA